MVAHAETQSWPKYQEKVEMETLGSKWNQFLHISGNIIKGVGRTRETEDGKMGSEKIFSGHNIADILVTS